MIYSFLFFKTIIFKRFIHGANEGAFMSDEFWDKKIETMPLDELKKLQLKRLKTLVRYIYDNNKFYHKKLKDAHVTPENIKTLKDIEKLPFLTKNDLREYYPFGLVCTEIDDIVEVHASSGTTKMRMVMDFLQVHMDLKKEHKR